MKFKNKVLLGAGIFLFLALSYFFLSFIPLRTELHLTPAWTLDISKPPVPETTETLLPFRLGNKAGYFTHSGKITSLIDIPYKATFSQNFYSVYDQDEDGAIIRYPSGHEACKIRGAGFPFIQRDRIYLFMPGGSSLAFVSKISGRLDTMYEGSSPITAFSSSENGSAAGFADGKFIIFDRNGIKKIQVAPGGSDYDVILGCDISASGKMFACISGLTPQRFVLYRDEGSYEKIIYHEFLKTNITRQTCVYFSRSENFVYFDSFDSLGIVNTREPDKKNSVIHIPLSGKILDIQESPVSDSVYVLSLDGITYTVTILENWNKKTGEFSFDADAAFILADGNTLFVGRDNKISRLTISKS